MNWSSKNIITEFIKPRYQLHIRTEILTWKTLLSWDKVQINPLYDINYIIFSSLWLTWDSLQTQKLLSMVVVSFLFAEKTSNLSSLVNVSWLKKKPHTFLWSHTHALFCFFFLSFHFINPSLTNSHWFVCFPKVL